MRRHRDPRVDAVLGRRPPRFHLDLTLRALAGGKHVLVEKPAFRAWSISKPAIAARDKARPSRRRRRKRSLQAAGGEAPANCSPTALSATSSSRYFTMIAKRLKTADDWRNDETMAGGDAFFEEGIHWLHLAGSLGPRIYVDRRVSSLRVAGGPDRRAKSMLVSSATTAAASARCTTRGRFRRCSRGCVSRRFTGREGVITFESNGLFILVRGRDSRNSSFPGSTTSAGTAGCIAIFSARFEREARPR